MKHGKKYIESAKSFDNQKLYDPEEGISVVLSTAKAKFDETIEAHIRLGVDSRHADQQVRGAVVLPHGTGKVVRVLVFAKGDKAREAQEAGADFVGDEDMVEHIANVCTVFTLDCCEHVVVVILVHIHEVELEVTAVLLLILDVEVAVERLAYLPECRTITI